jgi:hypothetical protein
MAPHPHPSERTENHGGMKYVDSNIKMPAREGRTRRSGDRHGAPCCHAARHNRMLGPPLELDGPSMRKSRLSVRLARRLDTPVQDLGAEVQITQDEIAGLVGVTRESVNRQLQEWRASGIVTLGRGRISVDRERLAVEARKACAGLSKAGSAVDIRCCQCGEAVHRSQRQQPSNQMCMVATSSRIY